MRQALQYDVEALKKQNRRETHNSAIAVYCHFYKLRSEFYRLRQNSNWTFKKLFQREPRVCRFVSAEELLLF